MPRLVDIAAAHTKNCQFAFSNCPPKVGVTPKPKQAQRKFRMRTLTVAERREFLDAYGPVLSLEKAAEIAGVTRMTLKKQLSQGKYADCVKRRKPIRFLTNRFVQEFFEGACP